MPVDSRTAKLVVSATEFRQLLALGERWQRACVKRANPVSLRKQNTTVVVRDYKEPLKTRAQQQ
jgi:hypothetical protein